ncbi:tRNA (adenosine(37)-N6)-threonylcarbamoyltransferase complex ATPase subunit type 1 TsaE [Litorimonas sp. RW-G-Af-16]|uniref:tRNA (adenosine(37)-N6)-threonylcarbamoyltransferase complex ATPase subunit type 1 TsaE n=1 Tax=Litorimonas sp. RW-G-Af-16 TaxID=3241168 RepID=UPI00390C427F
MTSYPLSDEAATLAFGARLARVLRMGDCVALRGELGAGKTTLVRGMIQSQLGNIEVPSPTYTLVQTYDMPTYELWHCDLYRLERPQDAYELGLIDAMDEIVSVIEWPDRLGDLLPDDALEISVEFEGAGRVVKLTGWDDRDV